MRFSFTIERLSVNDLGILLTLFLRARRQAWDADDMVSLIGLMARSLDGSLDDVPIAEFQACLNAFILEYAAFIKDTPAALEPFRRALGEQPSA